MKLQRYLTERMINKNPFILSNPSLPEVRNLFTKSKYNSIRGLYDNNTKKLFLWDASDEKVHYDMFHYLLQNGFIPEGTPIEDIKRIFIEQTFDDQGNEDVAVEVNQYNSVWSWMSRKYSSVPLLKKLFPKATDVNRQGYK